MHTTPAPPTPQVKQKDVPATLGNPTALPGYGGGVGGGGIGEDGDGDGDGGGGGEMEELAAKFSLSQRNYHSLTRQNKKRPRESEDEAGGSSGSSASSSSSSSASSPSTSSSSAASAGESSSAAGGGKDKDGGALSKYRRSNTTIRDTLICPITQQLMIQPVLAEDGYCYERAAILKWFERKQTSPVTNKVR